MVSFSEEIGHDSGGVKVEFFHCLFEEMTRPEYGMFTYPEDASYMWFPVTVSPLFFGYGYYDRKGKKKGGEVACHIPLKIRLYRLFYFRRGVIDTYNYGNNLQL